jgi:hypothetical protein
MTGGTVAKRSCICLCVLILGVALAGAQQGGGKESSASQFVGTWTGTWEGAGSSGGYELILEKGTDGALAGRVSVTGEPTYKATLKTLSFDGGKMTATYDFPPDDRLEVALAATFDGNTAKGTWVARGRSGGAEVANGTWMVTRK